MINIIYIKQIFRSEVIGPSLFGVTCTAVPQSTVPGCMPADSRGVWSFHYTARMLVVALDP